MIFGVAHEDYEHALGLARRQGYEMAKREFRLLVCLLLERNGGSATISGHDLVTAPAFELRREDDLEGNIHFSLGGTT